MFEQALRSILSWYNCGSGVRVTIRPWLCWSLILTWAPGCIVCFISKVEVLILVRARPHACRIQHLLSAYRFWCGIFWMRLWEYCVDHGFSSVTNHCTPMLIVSPFDCMTTRHMHEFILHCKRMLLWIEDHCPIWWYQGFRMLQISPSGRRQRSPMTGCRDVCFIVYFIFVSYFTQISACSFAVRLVNASTSATNS